MVFPSTTVLLLLRAEQVLVSYAVCRLSSGGPHECRNNGLFKYWEPAQIGNWLLAAPMLAISLFASYAYLQPPIPSQRLLPSNDKRLRGIQLHHLITTLLLVFVGNVQISLRVSVTNPVVWWTAAELAFDWSGGAGKMTRIGRWWVAWCVIWGAVSLILWAGFYPPA